MLLILGRAYSLLPEVELPTTRRERWRLPSAEVGSRLLTRPGQKSSHHERSGEAEREVWVFDIDGSDSKPPFRFAPPLTHEKFQTMRERRVRVLVVHSAELDKLSRATLARLKISYPDVVAETEVAPSSNVFEIRVDDRVVWVLSITDVRFGPVLASTYSQLRSICGLALLRHLDIVL